MNIPYLVAQYETSKQAMIDGYRGMHKAPEYLDWNDVQNLQDEMQAAAVALAEFMLTALSKPVDEPQPPASSPSLIAQTVDEILQEEAEMGDLFWQVNNALAGDAPILTDEGCEGTIGIQDIGLGGVQGDVPYFPSFDIIEDDLPSQIDAAEAEHPQSIPSPDAWIEASDESDFEDAGDSDDLFGWDDDDDYSISGY